MTQQKIKHQKKSKKLRIEAINRMLQKENWEEALHSLEQEAADFYQKEDWVSYCFLLAGIIPGFLKKENFLEAEKWADKLEKVLDYLEETFICRVYLHEYRAMLLRQKGNLDETLEEYKKAIHILQQLKTTSPSYLVKLMGEAGHIYSWKEDYSSAKIILRQALNLQFSSDNADPVETAIIYQYLGICYISLKNFEAAFDCLNKGLTLLLENLPENDSDILFAYAHFSSYHLSKALSDNLPEDYQHIIHYSQLILETKNPPTERFATDAYQNIGFAHIGLGNWEKAEANLLKSLELIRSHYGFEHPQLSDSHKFLGICYRKQEQWEAAKQNFQYALNSLYPNKNIVQNYAVLPPIKGYINASILLEILLEKGRTCYDAAILQKENSIKEQQQDLQISLETFDFACRILDNMRTGFDLTESKLLLTKKLEQGKLFEYGVKASLKAAELQLEVNGKNGNKWAFDFCEKAKANILMQAMQDHFAKASSNLPQDLLQRENQLKISLTRLDKNIQNLTSTQEQRDLNPPEILQLQQWQSTFYDEYESYAQLKKQLEEEHSDYFQVQYNAETIGVTALQELLEENQVLLNYFVGENSLFLFVCTSNDFEVIQQPKPDDFEASIEQFLQAIKHHDQANYVKKAAHLYEILLQSAEDYFIDWTGMEDELKHLIIGPDGVLSYVPFEALIRNATTSVAFSVRNFTSFEANTTTKAPSPTPYQNLDYLLKHTLVSYQYSASLYAYQKQKQSLQSEMQGLGNFAGFAPVYSSNKAVGETIESPARGRLETSKAASKNFNLAWATRSEAIRNDESFVPLPYSKLEVENIAQLFETKGLEAQTFLYETATKEQFEANAKRFRFLLVAAHGVVNDEKTALSGLVFAQSQPLSTVEDLDNSWNDKPITNSLLSMEETYHLDLSQTDLVVLSSCDSGIGRLVKGEGMMAVNRGFLYAGAKNVISTLFKVYDHPSSLLTQYLFEGILEGKSYTLALQSAKLRLIQQEGVTVKSWSGFVLIGQ